MGGTKDISGRDELIPAGRRSVPCSGLHPAKRDLAICVLIASLFSHQLCDCETDSDTIAIRVFKCSSETVHCAILVAKSIKSLAGEHQNLAPLRRRRGLRMQLGGLNVMKRLVSVVQTGIGACKCGLCVCVIRR